MKIQKTNFGKVDKKPAIWVIPTLLTYDVEIPIIEATKYGRWVRKKTVKKYIQEIPPFPLKAKWDYRNK